jgi:uncharacterized protein
LAVLDRYHYDRDGRLFIASARISRAGLSRYDGDEIPGWRELGLDPKREYQMLRDPDELRKAARTFAGLPLLSDHAPLGAKHRPELVIGAIGSGCRFDGDGFLRAPVTVWTRSAIDGIVNGKRRELSCAYQYKPPQMTPGTFRGRRYDGVMRDLIGSHVALVDFGRAGPSCGITLNMEGHANGKRFAA